MLASLRSGFAGTAFALVVVVVIAAVLTGPGHGPVIFVAHEGSGLNPYNILQVFIGVLLLTCFPVAVTMSALRHNQNTERKLRNRLRLLSDHSSDAIVLTDLDGRRLYVTPDDPRDPRPGTGGIPARQFPRPGGTRARRSPAAAARATGAAGGWQGHDHFPQPARGRQPALGGGAHQALP